MDGIKHSREFAELERLVSDYFNCHIAPVMSKTREVLHQRQVEEMKEYSSSASGILSMMASSAQPFHDPYQQLKVTSEWNSKTTEDYVEMCRTEIAGSEKMQHDLAYMAGQWRDTVVKEVGRARYDELSAQLGCDLAYAYMDHRVNDMMIDRLVKERIPQSSAAYILRKAGESSLLGLSQTLNRSPLAEEIEARSEAAYRPNGWEKGAGQVLGAAADTLMMGGTGSWTTLAKFVGADIAISTVADSLEPDRPESLSVEQCISKGVFGSGRNVFEDFRKEANRLPTKDNKAIREANGQLKQPVPVMEFSFTERVQNPGAGIPWADVLHQGKQRPQRYKDVPMVVAPGQEEAYLRDLKSQKETETYVAEQQETMEEEKDKNRKNANPDDRAATQEQPGQDTRTTPQNGNGWDGLLGTLGLDGMEYLIGNLGYVMAMLPDVLLGIFTGKSPSLRIGDNLLPIASIVAGMFVRNPLLKMLLIGLGSVNMLNKAGNEALQERSEGKLNVTGRNAALYRRYADEPLNLRIENPVLQGSTLIATIDRIPCTIQLSSTVAEAYHAGALPLNTLANAVLAKSDQLRQTASRHYEDGQQETIVRTRGIQ